MNSAYDSDISSGGKNNKFPGVTVVVPCRNERRFIEPFLRSLLKQDYPREKTEIIIADGMSDDGTREIVRSYSARDQRIKMVDNPGKIVSTGLNKAILESRNDIIIRMDTHTEYSSNYISKCVDALIQSGAGNVGGPARTKTRNFMQGAIAAAYHSPFAVGNASFHFVDFEGEVDTVTYGCWYKETLIKIGLFDEELVRNQDDELNLRLQKSGYKIWQNPDIKSWYYPRESLKKLFKQYYQYGYWKVWVIRKHRRPASLRQLVPAAFVLATLVSLCASIFFPVMRIGLIPVFVPYLIFISAGSVITAKRSNWRYLPVLPVIFATFHFGYGLGFLHGLMAQLLRKHKHSGAVTDLSR